MTFYASIIFMIYEHYQTDYFQALIISALVNLFIVSIYYLNNKAGQTETQSLTK